MNRYDNVSCFNAGAFPLRITGNDTSSYRCLKVGSESSRLHGRTVESRRTNFSRPEFWHVAPVICQIGGRTDALDDVTYENVIDVSEEEDSSLIKQKTKKESQRTLDMLLEIDSVSKEAFVTPLGEFPPVDKDELTPFCLSAVRAADKRKGIDPVALRISPWTFIASFLIIVSGKSEPQVRAITNSIEEDLQKQYNRVPRQISGKPASGWVLLDYGDVMINVFLETQRQYYKLEQRWSQGQHLDLSSAIIDAPPADSDDNIASNDDDWLV